jgi:hypothetical protein
MFHPERKGNNSGPIETLPLVLDILLFLPGVIPGVVALVIDFGTGAIYTEKKGNAKPFLTDASGSSPGNLADRSSTARGEGALELQVRVYAEDTTVLESRTITLDPMEVAQRKGAPLSWVLGDLNTTDWHQPATRVEVLATGGAPIVLPFAML